MEKSNLNCLKILFLSILIKGVNNSLQKHIISDMTKNFNQQKTVSNFANFGNGSSLDIATDNSTSFQDIFIKILGLTEPHCVIVIFYEEKHANFDWIHSILALNHPTTVSKFTFFFLLFDPRIVLLFFLNIIILLFVFWCEKGGVEETKGPLSTSIATGAALLHSRLEKVLFSHVDIINVSV